MRNIAKYWRALKQHMLGSIVRVNTSQALISLTFDDGPDPDVTPILLSILKKYRAKATFFMVGKEARRFPALVARVHAEGHAIGNHSWDHPSFPLITSNLRRRQILDCKTALTPFGTKIFRPPFGHLNLSARLEAMWLGYDIVLFDVVAEDWSAHDAEWMVAKLMREIRPGSIVLFHDALYYVFDDDYADRHVMLTAVEELLARLSGQFQFVTIPQLLKCGKPVRKLLYRKENQQWLNGLKRPYPKNQPLDHQFTDTDG